MYKRQVIYNVIKNEQNKQVKYLMMLYWIDKTDYLSLAQKYEEEKNVIMLIQVDGYDEVLKMCIRDSYLSYLTKN